MTVWSMNWNPGVDGRKCINVQPIESPKTDTVNGRCGSRCATARADRGSFGGDGETTATDETPGGKLPASGPPPGLGPTGTTSIVTAAAVAAVAPASGNSGTHTGRHLRIGRSITHHDTTDTASVAAHRTPNNERPAQPVRSPLSTRKIGQCQR